MKLNWYVMDWDNDKPVAINIFYAIDIEDLKKKLKYKGKKPNKYNSIKNYDELREYLKSNFMYRFWSKCEHEILVSDWPKGNESAVKIDVYAQISPNLDRITEYVIQELKLNFKYMGNDYDHTFGLERR